MPEKPKSKFVTKFETKHKKSKSSKKKQAKPDTKNVSPNLSDNGDFWNLDSKLSDTHEPVEDTLGSAYVPLEELDQTAKNHIDQQSVTSTKNLAKKEISNDSNQYEDSDEIEELDVKELLVSAQSETQDDINSESTATKPKEIVKKPKDAKSPIEKIATLVCYLIIFCIIGYLIKYASNQHDFSTALDYEANTPANGVYANIEKIDTWWSNPVSNNTKFGIILVPSATITLGPDSKSGVIRCIFYSDEEGLQVKYRPKGDPFTREFKNGKFTESGTNKITIHGTDGFEELSHYLFYQNQDKSRWTIDVKEAPSAQTDLNSFKPLAVAPIDPIRK